MCLLCPDDSGWLDSRLLQLFMSSGRTLEALRFFLFVCFVGCLFACLFVCFIRVFVCLFVCFIVVVLLFLIAGLLVLGRVCSPHPLGGNPLPVHSASKLCCRWKVFLFVYLFLCLYVCLFACACLFVCLLLFVCVCVVGL